MSLYPDQYDEMFRRFPGVEAYINACELQNEYRRLVDHESILNSWQQGRLAELRSYEVQFERDFYHETF